MPASKERNILFSVAVPKAHADRINALVKDHLPETASRNALFGAICALITPAEALAYYERARKEGAIGTPADAAKKRKLARDLVAGMSAEELERLLAERQQRAAEG